MSPDTTRREFLRSLGRTGALALLVGGLVALVTRRGPRRPCLGCTPAQCPQATCRFRSQPTTQQ